MFSVGRLSTGWKKPAKLYCTVTVKLQLDVCPAPSSAVALTVVVPTGNTEPEAGVLFTVTLDEQLSVAVTAGHLPTIDVAVEFIGRLTTTSAGHEMFGASVSWTVTTTSSVSEPPPVSVTV